MICHSNNARKLLAEADNSNNSREKVMLYLNAAKEYAKASEGVTDKVVQASLQYMAASATQKATLLQSIIKQYSSDNVLQLEQANRAMGKAKPSGPISETASVLNDSRLTYKAHQSRLAGINKIPKVTAPSEASMVKDFLVLEAKLNELGFRRPDHDLSQPPPPVTKDSLPVKLFPDLGESFIVLRPSEPVSPSSVGLQSPPVERRASNTSSDGDVSGYGGGSGVKIKNLSSAASPSASPSGATVLSSASLAVPLAWASNVMNTWGGFGLPGTADSAPSGGAAPAREGAREGERRRQWEDDELEGGEEAVNWNEQSMFPASAPPIKASVAGPQKGGGASSAAPAAAVPLKRDFSALDQSSQSHSHARYYDLMAQSAVSTATASSVHRAPPTQPQQPRSLDESVSIQRNTAGVENLLNTVKRLGEENDALLSRLERLSKVDEENRRLVGEMELFRRDFDDKFSRVKKVLKDYSSRYQSEGNPAAEGLRAAEQAELERQAAARAAAGGEGVKPASAESPVEEKKGGPAASGPSDAETQKRLKDLEKTVYALVARLEHAYADIKKRDAHITSLDPAYVAPPLPSAPGGRHHVHQSSSSRPSSSTSGGGASSSNRLPPPAPSSGSGSRAFAGALSPVPMKKQIIANPVIRHSSSSATATLEASLQQGKK